MRNAYKVVVGKFKGKKQLVRPSCRWEDNIKMDLKETACGNVDWTHLTQDRGHGTVSTADIEFVIESRENSHGIGQGAT
jgi:hypothetical protein